MPACYDPTTALDAAHTFAREHIRDPLNAWRTFVATSTDGQQMYGLWQIAQPGLEVILMTVMPTENRPTLQWITQPTGIQVLDGAFVGTRETFRPSDDRYETVVATGVLLNDRVYFPEQHSRYTIHAVGQPCTVLLARSTPFRPYMPERRENHTIAAMPERQAAALHRKMQTLLAK